MKRRARRGRSRALTLLEVVIAISLIGFLLASLLTFFWQTLEIRKVAGAASARTRLVSQVLDKMAGELKTAVAPEALGVEGLTVFAGDRRSVTFLSSPLPERDTYRIVRAGEPVEMMRSDLREVGYRLWIDPDKKTDDGEPIVGGIVRSERPAMTPAVQVEQLPEDEAAKYVRYDLWSYEIGYLEFRYFDGAEWSTTWKVSQGNPLPHLVQITVGFDSITQDQLDDVDLNEFPIDQYPLGPDKPVANRYSTIVRLAGADETFAARLYKLSDRVEEVYETVAPGGTSGGGTAGEKP